MTTNNFISDRAHANTTKDEYRGYCESFAQTVSELSKQRADLEAIIKDLLRAESGQKERVGNDDQNDGDLHIVQENRNSDAN